MMDDGYNRCDFAASFPLLSSLVNKRNNGLFSPPVAKINKMRPMESQTGQRPQ